MWKPIMLQRWRAFKAEYLGQHPLCRRCKDDGQRRFATAVVHRVVHGGDPAKVFNPELCQPVCPPCYRSLGARDVTVPTAAH